MVRVFIPSALGLLLVLSTTALGAGSRKGEICYAIDLSAQGAGKDVQLWLPYPHEDKNQTISDVRVEGDFTQSRVHTDSTGSARLLHASWEKDAPGRTLTFCFTVERAEVLHRNLPAAEPSWDPGAFGAWLGATALGPVDGEVLALSRSITTGQTSVLGKAKAIYDWVVENMVRDPDTRGCGLGDVHELLSLRGGKCADIHSVYVALARAAGVPAREVFGIRQGKLPTQDITSWQHCWAEFHLPGYGWVVVDPGDVRKAMLTENLTLQDARTQAIRAYYWGGVDPDRVRFNTGRDLVLVPAQAGGPVNYLMYPFAQVDGQTLDWLAPETFSYRITSREL